MRCSSTPLIFEIGLFPTFSYKIVYSKYIMDKVSTEDISAKHIQEYYQRLTDFKGISKDEFKSRIMSKTARKC